MTDYHKELEPYILPNADTRLKPPIMTLEEIQKRLDRIEALASLGDNEAAHIEEKILWGRVLWSVGEGKVGAEEAKLAFSSKKIKFHRYFS